MKNNPIFRNLVSLLNIAWKEDRGLFAAYFVSTFSGAVLLYVVYFIYKLMIDQVTRSVNADTTTVLYLIIIAYLLTEYLSRFVNFTFNQYYVDYFIRARLQNALTRRFMDKLASLDFSRLEDGDVRNLIAKVENAYNFRLPEFLHTVNAIVYNISALIFSLLVALQFNIFYFIILALVSVPIYYLRAKYGNIAWMSQTENAPNINYLSYLRSLFTNFSVLAEMKIYSLKDHFVNKTKELQEKVLEDYRRPIRTYTILSTLSFILIPVAIYFALIRFTEGVTAGKRSIGDFTFFLNALFTFSGQISSILINMGALYENSFYVNDYFSLMDIKNKIAAPEKSFRFAEVAPRKIVFDNVAFSYPGSNNLSLKNISFTIEKGENVAIVGHNGAGKSTLIKLLMRFYDPTAGRILIDGVDLKTIDRDQWYRHIGILFQDFARYFLTLKENIAFGNINLDSRERIEDAFFKAQGSGLLDKLPKKYDQYLGRWFHEGMELSGGQWQKVAIARAIYRDAPFLILDEPTSAIDADAETAIFENLMRLYHRKNLVFISHRFSTVRMADKIIVLENGQVTDIGPHDKLIQRKGLYAHFFYLQRKGYE